MSWRASHRLFSSMLGIFATQSLLSAVGIGAQRSLPAAAAINWVLKDGLGRLGRLGVAAAFGQSFDADVKVTDVLPLPHPVSTSAGCFKTQCLLEEPIHDMHAVLSTCVSLIGYAPIITRGA